MFYHTNFISITFTFQQKVREAMKSSESHKMNDRVQVDEFTIGGKEEGKQGRSYEVYILGFQSLI